MASYAVYWSEGAGPRYAGRLELTDSAAELYGMAVGRRCLESVPYGEIASVRLDTATLRVGRRRDAELDIGSVDGPGALRELADLLARAVARFPSLPPESAIPSELTKEIPAETHALKVVLEAAPVEQELIDQHEIALNA